jgi:AraC-binding-like domain
MPLASPLWEGRLLFRSRDADETRAFLDPFGLRFDPIGSDRALDARFNGEFLSGIYLGVVRFGDAALVRVDPEAAYAVELPLRGRFEAASCHEEVSCQAGQGVVLSPTRENAMRSEAGATRLGIALKREVVAQQLAALLGRAPDAPLEFAAALSLRRARADPDAFRGPRYRRTRAARHDAARPNDGAVVPRIHHDRAVAASAA